MRPLLRTLVASAAIGLCWATPSLSVELRVSTAQTCPQTGAPGAVPGEFALATIAIGLAGVFVEKAATGLIESAVKYLTEAPSATATGYQRQTRFYETSPLKADGKPQAADINNTFRCIVVVVGEFGEKGLISQKHAVLDQGTWRKMEELGAVGQPNLYFEGVVLTPDKNSETRGVFYLKPRIIYYPRPLARKGIFASGERDLALTIEFLKPGEVNGFAQSIVKLIAVVPDESRTIGPGYFASADTPWIPLPAVDRAGEVLPFTVKVTVLEAGKANTIDKALGEALDAKKGDIAKALSDAIAPRAPK